VVIGRNLLIAGGFLGGSACSDYVLVDYRKDTLVKSGKIHEGRYWHGIWYNAFHKKAYIVFGSNGVKSIEEYDLSQDSWTNLGNCTEISSISDTMAKAYKSAIYITMYNRNEVLKFDPAENKYTFMNTFTLSASTYKGILEID